MDCCRGYTCSITIAVLASIFYITLSRHIRQAAEIEQGFVQDEFEKRPSNVAVRPGEYVKMPCSLKKTEDELIWVSNYNKPCIRGDEFDDFNLIIPKASSTHAGSWSCQDIRSGKHSNAQIIIVKSNTPSCTPRDSSFLCTFAYSGNLNATLVWVDSQGNELNRTDLDGDTETELSIQNNVYKYPPYTCRAVFKGGIYTDGIERQTWATNSPSFSYNSCTTLTAVEQKLNVNESSNNVSVANMICTAAAIICTFICCLNNKDKLKNVVKDIWKSYTDRVCVKDDIRNDNDDTNEGVRETSSGETISYDTIPNADDFDFEHLKGIVMEHEQHFKRLFGFVQQTRCYRVEQQTESGVSGPNLTEESSSNVRESEKCSSTRDLDRGSDSIVSASQADTGTSHTNIDTI